MIKAAEMALRVLCIFFCLCYNKDCEYFPIKGVKNHV